MDISSSESLLARLRNVSEQVRFDTLAYTFLTNDYGPYNALERYIDELALELRRSSTWYHGGMIGRKVGELLQPPSVTGSDPRQQGDLAPTAKDGST